MIELPKDAEGREIPLDTKVLYDADGEEIAVSRYHYYPGAGDDGYWNIDSVRNRFYRMDEVHLIQPDSWEELLDDLARASANDPVFADPMCVYFNRGKKCRECNIDADSDKCENRIKFVFADIASRIRELRGED